MVDRAAPRSLDRARLPSRGSKSTLFRNRISTLFEIRFVRHSYRGDFLYVEVSHLRSWLACVVILGFGGSLFAENWAHWRGPTGNGSANAQPPTQAGPKQKTSVGRPPFQVVARARPSFGNSKCSWSALFEETAIATLSKCFASIVLRENRLGQTAIEATPQQRTHETNGFASASPCTDGERVYAHFGSRGLSLLFHGRKPIWTVILAKMNTENDFGEGSSPTLAGDKILVPWDHEGSRS